MAPSVEMPKDVTKYFEFIRPTKWDFNELPSLVGKTAIVTGANSPGGIGWNVAHQLALKGAKVFVGARSLQKAESGIAAMMASPPNTLTTSTLKPLVMDLGNYAQVKSVAEKFLKEEERLDILVNNAAILPPTFELDEHGISTSMGTNHLGPFLLTTTLLPLLVKTAKVNDDIRIVNIASTAHFIAPAASRFRGLEDFNQSFGGPDDPQAEYLRYGYSKLANVLFTAELQRRLSSQTGSILVMSLCPGGVQTNGAAALLGGRDSDVFKASLTPLEGALTPLFAAAHPEPRQEMDKYKGGYLLPWGGLKEPSEKARDEGLAKELWESSERILEGVLKK